MVLLHALEDPVDLDIAFDDKIYIIERKGNIKVHNSGSNTIKVVGKLEVHNIISGGLFGLALDPHFTNNQRIYLQYTPLEDTTIQYVSQFQLERG